jgi:hypothetical protein
MPDHDVDGSVTSTDASNPMNTASALFLADCMYEDSDALLEPSQVSDDDVGGSVTSSETTTPMNTAPTLVSAKKNLPSLPTLQKKPLSLLSAAVIRNHKRRSVSDDSAVTPKKAKSSSAATIKTSPVPLTPSSAALAARLENHNTPNPLEANKTAYKIPELTTMSPKPLVAKPTTMKPLKDPAPIITTLKSAIAPCIEQPEMEATTETADETCTTTTANETTPAPPADTEPLNDKDRAQQCRDRNRQHARNTRIRKKAHVEEIKRQLLDMVNERDAALLKETQKAKIVEQQREVRFQVMQDFLQLRGRNEANPNRWAAILEDGFTLTLPKTAFQTMVATSDVNPDEQLLIGVPDIMADATFFSSFLQSLGEVTATTTAATTTTPAGDDTSIPIKFVYHCDRSSFLMDNINAILSWTGTSIGAIQRVSSSKLRCVCRLVERKRACSSLYSFYFGFPKGATKELELRGSMRARFCSQTNRLEMAKIHFDTGFV